VPRNTLFFVARKSADNKAVGAKTFLTLTPSSDDFMHESQLEALLWCEREFVMGKEPRPEFSLFRKAALLKKRENIGPPTLRLLNDRVGDPLRRHEHVGLNVAPSKVNTEDAVSHNLSMRRSERDERGGGLRSVDFCRKCTITFHEAFHKLSRCHRIAAFTIEHQDKRKRSASRFLKVALRFAPGLLQSLGGQVAV